MPEEQQPHEVAVVGTSEQQPEQRFKTLALRVEEGLHAQLRFIAQLNGTSLSDEIRRSLESRVTQAQEDPDLIARAEQAREEIEREAAARSSAIAGFIAKPALESMTRRPTSSATSSRSKRSTKPAGE